MRTRRYINQSRNIFNVDVNCSREHNYFFWKVVTDYISTVYGFIEGNIVTEIPSGRRYKVRANYRKSKPTWFNLGLNWFEGDYSLIKIFDFEFESNFTG